MSAVWLQVNIMAFADEKKLIGVLKTPPASGRYISAKASGDIGAKEDNAC